METSGNLENKSCIFAQYGNSILMVRPHDAPELWRFPRIRKGSGTHRTRCAWLLKKLTDMTWDKSRFEVIHEHVRTAHFSLTIFRLNLRDDEKARIPAISLRGDALQMVKLEEFNRIVNEMDARDIEIVRALNSS